MRSVFLLGQFLILWKIVCGLPVDQQELQKRYAVVIDAGSTGSRVHCFEFHTNQSNSDLVLGKEFYKKTRPGLSSYADNPDDGVNSIKFLLDEAKNFVPRKKWRVTPLVLKATAGLRMLPAEKSKKLLSAVRELFTEYEFSVNENSVEIINGTSEGIFSWLSVNFLLQTLSDPTQSQTAVLDLGGGSTQITFPADPLQDAKNIHAINVLDKDINLYANSYLGLGLSAARHAVLTKGYKPHDTVLESECVHPLMKNKTLAYGNVKYDVSGRIDASTPSGEYSTVFERCLESVKSLIHSLLKPQPLTLKENTVIALNGYFWGAIGSGLITDHSSNKLLVKDYRQKARDVCMTPVKDKPFSCFDLTYISALLEEGFDLPGSQEIKIYHKIDDHSISWALGAAYYILTSGVILN